MLCLLVSCNRKALICRALGICAEAGMEKPSALLFFLICRRVSVLFSLQVGHKNSLCCFSAQQRHRHCFYEDVGTVFMKTQAVFTKIQALFLQSDQNLGGDTSDLIILLQCHRGDFHLQPNKYQANFFMVHFFCLLVCMKISQCYKTSPWVTR